MDNNFFKKLVNNLFVIDEQKRYLYTPQRHLGPAYIIPDARTFEKERNLHIIAHIALLMTAVPATLYSLWLGLIPLTIFFVWMHLYHASAKRKWQAIRQKPIDTSDLPPFSDTFPKPLLIGMIVLASPLMLLNTATLLTKPSLEAFGYFIFSLALMVPPILILKKKLQIEKQRKT